MVARLRLCAYRSTAPATAIAARSGWRPADGGPPRRFTAGAKSDTTPRWSPDGRRLAFCLDSRRRAAQIYMIDLAGGEARKLTSLPLWRQRRRPGAPMAGGSPFSAAPARPSAPPRTAAKAAPEPDDEWEREQAEARRKHDEEQRFDPRVLTRLPYRGGTSFFDDRRNHIYVIDLPDDDEDAAAHAAPPDRWRFALQRAGLDARWPVDPHHRHARSRGRLDLRLLRSAARAGAGCRAAARPRG